MKSDDQSASTLNTTSSQCDNLDEITHLVRTLQESDIANKKMRDAFSCSLQTQTTLQAEVLQLKQKPTTQISNTDSIFWNLQSKLDSKLEAMATKTSTALDMFHQKPEAHRASTI